MDLEGLTINAIRVLSADAIEKAKSGHPGGSLGAADLITELFFEEMDLSADNASSKDRDRFVLSKGHTSPMLYAALAEKGIIPEEELMTFRRLNSRLQGHPNMNEIPGVDMSSGSLGQGISAAVGMALSGKLRNKDYRVYTLLGDGEIEEGQVWEASMFAGNHALDNLVVIVDNNNLQIDGPITEVNSPYPIDRKFEAFKFHVINVADGNDFDQLRAAFKEAREVKGMPTAIVAGAADEKTAKYVQDVFMNEVFRVYTSPDRKGMQIGAALKNVVALGAGIADGLGYGDNAKAALITRGIHEISQLGTAMGGRAETFSGLTGIGDLIVTCASMHSRNRRAGILIGQGKTYEEAMAEVKQVVEGVYSAKAAVALGKQYNVELPIITEVSRILFEGKPAADGVRDLMLRDRKVEINDLDWSHT